MKNNKNVWVIRIGLLSILLIGLITLMVKCSGGDNEPNPNQIPDGSDDLIVSIMDATSVYGENVVEDFDFSFDALKSGITITKEELQEHLTFEKEPGNEVGTYAITGTADQELGLKVKFIPGEYTITKATYDMSNVHFEDQQVEYNGEIQNITITGKLPEGVKVSYNYSSDPTEVGTYTVTAKFTGDEANYNPIPDMTAHLTIVPKNTTSNDDNHQNGKPNSGTEKPGTNKPGTTNSTDPKDPENPGNTEIENGPAYIDVQIDIMSRTSVYGQPIQDLDFEFTVLNGERNLTKEELKQCIHLKKEDGTDVGEYRITGTCSREDIRVQFIMGTYTITKATYDMTNVHFNDDTVIYNGKSHSLFVRGQLPEGVTVTYEGNGKIATGFYKVIAHFAGDAKNYEPIPDKVAYLTIKRNSGSGDDTYRPTHRWYTITFVDYDGSVLKTETVKRGKMPTPPANPTRPDADGKTYTFNGWSPTVVAATKDATYTATYTAKDIVVPTLQYKITFVNYDGSVLKTETVKRGEMPTPPANPTRPDADGKTYTFAGWNPTVVAATKDTTYTATYTEKDITDPNPPVPDTPIEYTVTFVDYDGTVLQTGKVEEGKTPTPPADPKRPEADGKKYTFTGWNPVVAPVTGDTTYTATYKEEEVDPNPPILDTPIEYTITFVDYDGSVLKTENVKEGDMPTPPTDPNRPDADGKTYTFNGWSPTVSEARGDTSYTATYTEEEIDLNPPMPDTPIETVTPGDPTDPNPPDEDTEIKTETPGDQADYNENDEKDQNPPDEDTEIKIQVPIDSIPVELPDLEGAEVSVPNAGALETDTPVDTILTEEPKGEGDVIKEDEEDDDGKGEGDVIQEDDDGKGEGEEGHDEKEAA